MNTDKPLKRKVYLAADNLNTDKPVKRKVYLAADNLNTDKLVKTKVYLAADNLRQIKTHSARNKIALTTHTSALYMFVVHKTHSWVWDS